MGSHGRAVSGQTSSSGSRLVAWRESVARAEKVRSSPLGPHLSAYVVFGWIRPMRRPASGTGAAIALCAWTPRQEIAQGNAREKDAPLDECQVEQRIEADDPAGDAKDAGPKWRTG